MPQKAVLTAALAVTLGLSAALQAASPDEQIKYRQNVMKALGGHTGAATLIVQGKSGHPDHLLSHAQGMAAIGTQIGDLFPAGSGESETAARPEIWSQPEEFGKAVTRTEEATAAFLAAVESGDQEKIGAAMKDVGGSCKGCHDDFRRKKE
ncbi:MAG: cytochrome c [Pseudomonadota bacterium]|nr:cytochrome c [Pseudomonadota bacterium]